jgi:hypothetical protein
MAANVVMNPVALAALLRSPSGPVYRRGLEDANLVKREAQRRCPVGKATPGRGRSPGTLRDSIVVRVREGPVFEVGSADPVALWVHEGTEPHQIVGNPLLVFHWAKLGKVVAFRQVNHPGTKPNRFLVEALTVLNGR